MNVQAPRAGNEQPFVLRGTKQRLGLCAFSRGCRRKASSTPRLRACSPSGCGEQSNDWVCATFPGGVVAEPPPRPGYERAALRAAGNKATIGFVRPFPGVSSQNLLHARLRACSPSGCGEQSKEWVCAPFPGGVVAEPPPRPATSVQPFGRRGTKQRMGLCAFSRGCRRRTSSTLGYERAALRAEEPQDSRVACQRNPPKKTAGSEAAAGYAAGRSGRGAFSQT